MSVVIRYRHWILVWGVLWFGLTAGSNAIFAQGAPRLVSRLDTIAIQDTIRALLGQAARLASAITPPDSLYFGHNIFQLAPEAFQLPALGAVDPEYPLGPGDEIVLSMWGQVELNYTLTVDQNGDINIPRVGRLQVVGMPLGALQHRVTQFFAPAYTGISEDPAQATTFINVALGKLRSIQVFVVGEVRTPRAYIVNATATVLNTLYRAGGPTPKGSLRNIRLVRHDKVASYVDLYRFLLDGDKSEDVRLQNGDVVYVPLAGKRVRLKGQVRRPAIYELKGEEGLRRLIEIAGGLEPGAYAERVQIERIVRHREQRVIDVNLAELLLSEADFGLSDGDVVSVFKIRDAFTNAVTLRGYVTRPGRYQLLSDMRVRDLIQESEGILPEAYRGRADLVRTNPDLTKTLIPFHLGKALAGEDAHNLPLSPLDEITVYSIHTFGDRQFVTIDGLVRKPGRYELFSSMGLQDLIVLAGGLRDVAYKLEAEVARSDPDAATPDRPVQVFKTKISDIYDIDSKPTDKLLLQNRDAVFIRPHPEFEPQQYVKLQGEVRFPGTYALGSRSERLTEIISQAGGMKEGAYPQGVNFHRPSVGRIAVDLPAALKHPGGPEDIVLQDGDVIELPPSPSTVEVAGAVYSPKHILFRPGKGVDYYLERAGGLRVDARKGDIYVERANGEILRSGGRLFWRAWPRINAGSRIVVPAKTGAPPPTASQTVK